MILNRREVDILIAALPRCERSVRSVDGKPKLLYPLEKLAIVVAERTRGEVYRCKGQPHWHVMTARRGDKYGAEVRVRRKDAWAKLMDDARAMAKKEDQRIHVFAQRTTKGRWVYRPHFAEYRDWIVRAHSQSPY